MLRLEIVTPEERVLDADVDSVTVTTASGEVGILPNHAPMVSALKPGVLSYSAKSGSDRLLVTGGFVEVSGNKVAVLADSAEHGSGIDLEAARVARAEAEKELASVATAALDETENIRTKFEVAAARIEFASGK